MSLDAAPVTAADRLREIVRQCLDSAPDRARAAERLLEQVRGDRELWKTLMEPFERRAAAEAVGHLIRADRLKAWGGTGAGRTGAGSPGTPATDGPTLAVALGNIGRALLDYRLPTGTPLRDATAADLQAAEAIYRTQADNMAWKARWLARLRAEIEATDPAATVGATLTEARLRALQGETA